MKIDAPLRADVRHVAENMRQKDIVERTGFSQGRVSHICLGRIKSVESHSLFALADALECDARWLATGEDE